MGIELNKIYVGDCLEILPKIPDESVDCLITDPPYSSGGMFRGDRMQDTTSKYQQTGQDLQRPNFSGDNRDQRAYAYWSALWLGQCWRILKPGAVAVIFTDWRQLPVTTDIMQAGGFLWRGIGVWDKTEASRPSKGRFRNQCEFIVWGSKGPMGEQKGMPCLPGVWRKSVISSEKHHLTGKPLEVMVGISRICPPQGIILDPFLGSGSTALAAEAEGRRWIGIEMNAEYASVAEQRISTERRQLKFA